MRNKAKWLRISSGVLEGLYQIKPWQGDIDLTKIPDCPCCTKPLKPGVDICQWGMFDDEYHSYLICPECVTAFELYYRVPTYALVSKRAQRASGLILPSKEKPAKRVAERKGDN